MFHASGDLYTPSIARWKACGRLPIRHDRTLFTISYGWEVISKNLSKLAFFLREVGQFECKFQTKGHRPPTAVGVRQPEWLPFRLVSKCPQCNIWFRHKHACDGRTVIMTPSEPHEKTTFWPFFRQTMFYTKVLSVRVWWQLIYYDRLVWNGTALVCLVWN